MKRILLVVAIVLLPFAVLAQVGGIAVYPATAFTFTDCASGGSAAQTITKGSWLFIVTDSDVFVCYAATCAAGGTRYAVGSTILIAIEPTAGQQVSCRSTASTGDVSYTKAGSR